MSTLKHDEIYPGVGRLRESECAAVAGAGTSLFSLSRHVRFMSPREFKILKSGAGSGYAGGFKNPERKIAYVGAKKKTSGGGGGGTGGPAGGFLF